MKVMRSVIIEAAIDKVWAAVRDFDSVVNWNPGVTGARMETGSPTAVGSIRHRTLLCIPVISSTTDARTNTADACRYSRRRPRRFT